MIDDDIIFVLIVVMCWLQGCFGGFNYCEGYDEGVNDLDVVVYVVSRERRMYVMVGGINFC